MLGHPVFENMFLKEKILYKTHLNARKNGSTHTYIYILIVVSSLSFTWPTENLSHNTVNTVAASNCKWNNYTHKSTWPAWPNTKINNCVHKEKLLTIHMLMPPMTVIK